MCRYRSSSGVGSRACGPRSLRRHCAPSSAQLDGGARQRTGSPRGSQAPAARNRDRPSEWAAETNRSLSDGDGCHRPRASDAQANSAKPFQCEEQDSNLHVLRTLEPKRTQEPLLSANLLGKDASADVLRGSEKTHSGQDVPEATDVVTMSDVRACARAIVQRVADGGEIPIASLRELADLVLRSELVAVSQQLLDGPPEFALRRAMELAGLILAVVASDGRDAEQRAAK